MSFDPGPTLPSSPHDDRPLIKELLADKAAQLIELQQLICEHVHYKASLHDDVWLLRFLLSHERSGVKAAAAAVCYTLDWRHRHGMDAVSDELRRLPTAMEHPAVVRGHSVYCPPGAMEFIHPDPARGPVLLCTFARCDFHAAAAKLGRDEYAACMRATNEWFFLQCDRVSRETGRLTRSLRVVQLKGIAVRSLNRTWLNMDAAVARDLENCYPQLVGLVVCLDPPSWALAMWRAVKVLFPARLIEKILIIPRSARAELERKLQRFVALEDLPELYGGAGAG